MTEDDRTEPAREHSSVHAGIVHSAGGHEGEASGQRTHDSFLHRSWRWLVSALLAGLALVVSGYVADANHWFQHQISGSAAVLRAVVTLGNPLEVCNGETGYVFPAKPQALPLPPHGLMSNVWAIKHHGIPAGGNYIDVVLQGVGSSTVIVTDLRVEVVTRKPPPAGTYPVGGGCGGLTPNLFRANLDTSPVTVRPVAGVDQAFNKIPAVALPHEVSESSPEVWHISADTSTCDCDWIAFIDYTSDGKSGELKITNQGKPFRVAAVARATMVLLGSKGHWTTYGDG